MVFEPTFEEFDADAAARDAALADIVDPEAPAHANDLIDPEAPADAIDDADDDLTVDADAAIVSGDVEADDLPAYGEE